jgi:hypothetical protein
MSALPDRQSMSLQDADALRIVGKRFLIDLWEADRARA